VTAGSGDGQAADLDPRRWARFGDRPNQILHPDTVDAMLQLWRERDPAHFGATLAEVLTGARLVKARAPR
jgi:hypothetical protein